jgi:protein-glutamine gamma-glutamyltransferase
MKKALTFEQIQRSIRLGAFLLVCFSALALALTQRMAISALLLAGAVIVAWFWIPGNAKRSSIWEIASFAYLLFFFFDLLRVSQALAPALVHLFIFILINKMFNLHNIRDYYQLYLLTFLTVLAASSLSVEIEMFYMIIGYILLLIWNIVSITLYQEWKQDESLIFPFSLFHPLYILGIFVAGALTFIFALSIFFILPRMQLGYLSELSAGKTQHVSGFSQKVTLGEIANIEENSDVAMRVRVSPDNSDGSVPYYWRGISFDHYDGKAWTTGYPGNRFLSRDFQGLYNVSTSSVDPQQLVTQEFYLAPLDTRVVFGLDKVMKIKGDLGEVSRDTNGSLMAMSRPQHYEVFSRVNRPTLAQLNSAGRSPIPDRIQRYHLQLPQYSPQIEQLAQSITKDRSSMLDKVVAVEKYLQTNYRYSLTDITQDAKDPVSKFLFETKKGHCEYFSTSMVILLRHLGIPSRIVNGFLQGEYNEIGGFYVVRNSDAHSWVEVYFDGTWVPFDPSPRPEFAAANSNKVNFDFHKILESINFFWDRYILIFSGQDQVDAFMAVRDRYQEFRSRVSSGGDHDRNIFELILNWWKKNRKILAIIVSSIVLLVVSIPLILRHRRALKISRSPILFYQEMLSILEKKGFRRKAHTTPAEFMQVLQKQLPDEMQADLNALTEMFYRTRFGQYQLTEIEQLQIRDSLQRLRQ